MIASGDVPVGHPVTAAGAATSDRNLMAGVAGRGEPTRTVWRDGEDFPLITDKECLIFLNSPMDIVVGGLAHRLPGRESHYVTVAGGKIVDLQSAHFKR